MGLLGAFMTAAYMTRCIYLTFFGEYRGHGRHAHPHESGPRITIPLIILAALAVVAGCVNLPNTGPRRRPRRRSPCASSTTSSPRATYFPRARAPSATPSSTSGSRSISTAIGVDRDPAGLPSGTSGAWGPHGLTERNRLARLGYRVLVEQVLLRLALHRRHRRRREGPDRPGRLLVQPEGARRRRRRRGHRRRRSGRFVYEKIDQGVVDSVVNGSGCRLRGLRAGPAPASRPAGAAVRRAALRRRRRLAGIFIIVI